MKDALEELKGKGSDGSFPRGCIHDKEDIVEFESGDSYHSARICSKCLEELVSGSG